VKTYEVLEKALGLIEDERHWCRGAVGRGGARCAIGALNFATVGIDQGGKGTKAKVEPVLYRAYVAAVGALNLLAERDGFETREMPRGSMPAVAFFNNSHSHAEVVALFQEAIRNEKAKAGVPVDLPAPVAQQAERLTCNQEVAGSIPAGGFS
jgi:hypothetical protein